MRIIYGILLPTKKEKENNSTIKLKSETIVIRVENNLQKKGPNSSKAIPEHKNKNKSSPRL